jgi:predicted choloylglycine hydrolase
VLRAGKASDDCVTAAISHSLHGQISTIQPGLRWKARVKLGFQRFSRGLRCSPMLVVDVIACRGTAFEVGVQNADAFLATPRGKGYLRRKRMPAHQSFSLPDAERAFGRFAPNLWAEMQGMAARFGLPLEQVIRDFGNFTLRYPKTGCSTVFSDGHSARNYDFTARDYEPRFAAVRAEGSYASFGFTQFLIGRADGMNEKGLVCGLHIVSFRYPAPGFLASLIVRMILDRCATTEEAIRLLHKVPHGFCYNFSLLDAAGDGAVVEAAPRNIAVRRGTDLACTNHFQSRLMKPLNPKFVGHSQGRLPPLEQWANSQKPQGDLFDQAADQRLYGLLNNSRSPAFHRGYAKGAGTLHTIVASPTERRMLVGVGGDTPAVSLDLRLWMGGANLPCRTLQGQLGGTSQPFGVKARAAQVSAAS